MRLVAINGSHRGEKGWTAFLINQLVTGAESAGAQCTVVTLSKLKINRCLSCYECQQEGRECAGGEAGDRCVWHDKDDAAGVFQLMAAADILLFGTPVYVLGMSGLLKTFIDRLYATMNPYDMHINAHGLLHHRIDPAVSSKPFVTLVTCGNLEEATPSNVLHFFKTYARFMDAPQVGVLVRNGAPLLDAARSEEGAARLPAVARVYAAYQQAGRELATVGLIRRETQRIANQELIAVPAFHLLKRLPFVKRMVIAQARSYLT